MYGDGFEKYHFQSLSKIRARLIDRITTVDGRSTYAGFEQISRTINEIVARELRANKISSTKNLTFNFPEYDEHLSPDDHSDHLNTAGLLQGTQMYDSIQKNAFVHYNIQYVSSDLHGPQLFWKVGMFGVYHQTVLNEHGHSTIGETPAYYKWSMKKAVCRPVS
jgi:hypothetical protein